MYGHAIVIGGGIAGMIAARVLADHFERVTVLERDTFPLEVDFRDGIPQARHSHILLKRGEIILEQLFPGIVRELELNGAYQINFGKDIRWYSFGRWRPSYETDLATTGCSRPMLDHFIRKRLMTHPNIDVREKCEIAGLETDPDRKHAIGVRYASRNGSISHNVLTGDLVVDSSGRESQAPNWLEELGYERPRESKVNAFVGYATRIYRRPANVDWQVTYMQPIAPILTRGGIITPLEGNRWHVTLIGMNGDYPPINEKGFLEFASSLPSPEIYEALKDAEPITPPIGFRKAENRLNHYETLSRYLENFVLLGDSVYALNPVYGQGMSVAAIGAELLGDCLTRHRETHQNLDGLAENFQKQLAEVNAFPWQIATGEDMRWPGTEGGELPTDPEALMTANYFGQVIFAATRNPIVLDALYRVQSMIESPAIFFRPEIVIQVVAMLTPVAV
jgi:2-polyprenyl-6-methoxyphenol hydroxylase-like FAD-dependent oxidoreductase